MPIFIKYNDNIILLWQQLSWVKIFYVDSYSYGQWTEVPLLIILSGPEVPLLLIFLSGPEVPLLFTLCQGPKYTCSQLICQGPKYTCSSFAINITQ